MTEQNNLQHRDGDQEKKHVHDLLQRIKQEAKECALELALPEQAGYDVLAVIHGQALLGEREMFHTKTSLPSLADKTSSPFSTVSSILKSIGQPLDDSGPQDHPPNSYSRYLATSGQLFPRDVLSSRRDEPDEVSRALCSRDQ